jgi:hypothetical protein
MTRNELMHLRLEKLVSSDLLSSREAQRFQELDEQMKTLASNSMEAFYNGREYARLLEKVIDGLVHIGEPLADKKKKLLSEEIGTMSPAVFLTPWEMTLDSLDETIPGMERVLAFYSPEDGTKASKNR